MLTFVSMTRASVLSMTVGIVSLTQVRVSMTIGQKKESVQRTLSESV